MRKPTCTCNGRHRPSNSQCPRRGPIIALHYRFYPAGPPPYPREAWTRCGLTVPYDRATDELSKVTCRRCWPKPHRGQS